MSDRPASLEWGLVPVTLPIMGRVTAVLRAARDLVALPRPITLELEPLHTFDTTPRPVDQVLMAMREGESRYVTREQALGVPAVQRGRNELASIATLPLRLYRGQVVIESPLFRQFDPDVPNVVHMAMTIEDLAFEAVAWWRVTGQDFDGFPASVSRVDPAKVRLNDPATGKPDPNWVWIDHGDGKAPERVAAQLMKRFDSPNPGVLRANARAVRIALKLDRLTEMYADNPALREYFTDNDEVDGDLMEDGEIAGFLAEWNGARQYSPVGWIPSNVKRADVANPSPKDLTLTDLRTQVMLSIANGLGVDPEDLGVSTTSRTYFNSVDKKQDKINRTYAPFMQALTDRLGMGDITRRGQAPRFDLTDYLKSDPVTQSTYWKALQDMGVVDAQWIGEQAGVPAEVVTRAQQTPPAEVPVQNSRPALRIASAAAAAGHRFGDDGPIFTFHATDFAAAAPAAPTVDEATRTITGLAVPYNAVATKYGLNYTFAPGSLEYSDPARMAHLKDHTTPVGFHRSVTDTAEGPMVALAVLDGPEGSPAKAERDQLLYDAAHGLYSGLSVGVDFSLDPDAGDVEYDAENDLYRVVRATWRETSTTYMPAFDDARVTTVAASRSGGRSMEPCQHCGHRHAANIACRTFAQQLNAQPTQPTQPAPVPAPTPQPAPTAPSAATFEQFQQFIAQQQHGIEPHAGPVLVSPHRDVTAEVTEPSPYRFDRHGNLRAGSHDFSADLYAGWKHGDQAARDRAQGFIERQFNDGHVGSVAPLSAEQQFAITPANVTNLNYPQNRPDLYVDQLDYQYPMYAAMNKGTLDAVTPFIIPKFSSSSGLVADHVTGTEPTPGTFVATAQTITPSALSGKVEITREAFDQGGNPQMSGLIWRQMVRAWYEGLEAYAQAQLVAAAASIPDLTITTAAADSTLDQALADAIVPLQYIRGGDRFRTVFTQIDLYKAMVKAKDTTGRRLYPSIGAQNAVGTADPRYAWVEAHGKLWVPAWATAATGSVAASSWMFDPEVVCLWASTPKQINLEWRVAWVDLGIWGYKAFGVTDFTRTREVVYDPI
jgi:hypothetical protein